MCLQHLPALKRKKSYAFHFYFLSIISGFICGFSDFLTLQRVALLISDLFIKIFKCISLPIIALSIIVTLCQYSTTEIQMKKIGQKTLFYTLGTTLIAAGVACLLYFLMAPSNIAETSLKMLPTQNSISDHPYLDYVLSIIPSTIFSPFLEHQVMGTLLVSMLMGIAIRYIPEKESRSAIIHFFKGAHGIFLVITSWVVKIIPLALFGFISTTVVQLKSGVNIQGLSGYLIIIVLANIIQGLVILPAFLYFNKIRPFQTLKGMMPALSVAFFSKSSTGTLPITIETAEQNLGISPRVSRFVLPLCTSINMNGCAAFIFTTVIYLMQNQGIEITWPIMIAWIFVATIAAIGNAGVPMGCFFLSASLLTSMDVPITLLGLILPFYSLIDMIETALNVWSDSCVAKVVDEQIK